MEYISTDGWIKIKGGVIHHHSSDLKTILESTYMLDYFQRNVYKKAPTHGICMLRPQSLTTVTESCRNKKNLTRRDTYLWARK